MVWIRLREGEAEASKVTCSCCNGCRLVNVRGCMVCVRCDLAGQFPALRS